MTAIYLVRHGETEWNRLGKLQGQLDSALTKEGIAASLKLKERLCAVPWQAVYSSPSGRALHTARILVDASCIQTDRRLLEMALGDLEGCSWEAIKANHRTLYDHYWYDPIMFQPVRGESFHDVGDRLLDFFQDLASEMRDQNVLIVTHGVVIKLANLFIKNECLSSLWNTPHIPGASFIKITWPDLIAALNHHVEDC